MDNNTNPKTVSDLVAEVVDSVNKMTYEDGQRAMRAAGYGVRPNDYRSFWD